MFTVYLDDSGTSPSQNVAIASALIVPAKKIRAFSKEWNRFKKKAGIGEFHAAELVAGNMDTVYAGWELARKKRVCARVRKITKKHGAKAFSLAVKKADYEEFMAPELLKMGGRFHYTWAIRNMLAFLAGWAAQHGYNEPFHYVFDGMGPDKKNPAKAEIRLVIEQAEHDNPGFYEGHYNSVIGEITQVFSVSI